METGLDVRDDDEDVVELPTSWTKRGLYVKWARSHGWDVTLQDDKGTLKIEPCPNYDGEQRLAI
eukprot:13610893-Ditylum_brightwellii.AAC.1